MNMVDCSVIVFTILTHSDFGGLTNGVTDPKVHGHVHRKGTTQIAQEYIYICEYYVYSLTPNDAYMRQ